MKPNRRTVLHTSGRLWHSLKALALAEGSGAASRQANRQRCQPTGLATHHGSNLSILSGSTGFFIDAA